MGRTTILAVTTLGGFVLAAGCMTIRNGAADIENGIVFQPAPYPAGNWRTDPRVEDASIESTDGIHLHGWYAEPAGKPPRAVVLFTYGNGGNVAA